MKLWVLVISIAGRLIPAARYSSAARCEISLPQNCTQECEVLRNAALATNKKSFSLTSPPMYGFARANITPDKLAPLLLGDPFSRYYTTLYLNTVKTNKKALETYNNDTRGQEVNDLSEYSRMTEFFQPLLEPLIGEYGRVASRYEAFIDNKAEWINDKHFTQQRFAGVNPMSIQRVTIHGQERIGLDWNKLKETLNPKFDWETAVQEVLKTKLSLKYAIKKGRIYALRYELCDDMDRQLDLTDRDPRRTMWKFLSPIALFASVKVGGEPRNELVPVAIQMDFKPDSAVYTPKNGDNWMLAKLNVQITDIGYSQIAEHLGRSHFFLEPFCVILKRTLSYQHPLHQILKFHCRELLVPNTFGVPNLLGENKLVSALFAFGSQGAYRLLNDTYKLTTWGITDYRGNIKKRGLDNKTLLPYFPFRDDGYIILKVIEKMVKGYVDLYYKQEKDVEEDKELQAYLNELSSDGTGPNGGIGKIQEFPASIKTKQELWDILSRILGHMVLHHTSVNYVTTDYPEYIPNLPTKLYDDTRVGEGQFSVYRLPSRLTSALQGSAFNLLGVLRFDTLFDYGNELQDDKAVNLVNSVYSHLMRVVQPCLQQKNQRRKEMGDLTYPYFIPKWLPNGIQT